MQKLHSSGPSQMTPEEQETFEWAYSICRTDQRDALPVQFFQRVAHAKSYLLELEKVYPDIPFGIFARGDRLYLGHPEIHENIH
jgi:hypothetical protein